MITINSLKELEKYKRFNDERPIHHKAVYKFDFNDDVTITFSFFWQNKKYDCVFNVKNITFKEDVYIPYLYTSGNIHSEKTISADNIRAKKDVIAKKLECNNLLCKNLNVDNAFICDECFVDNNINCNYLNTNYLSCFGKIDVQHLVLNCNDLHHVTAIGDCLDK